MIIPQPLQQMQTEVKLRNIISEKGNKCLIVQTKLDVKVLSTDGQTVLNEDGTPKIVQFTGVIPLVGNETLRINEIIPANVALARDKLFRPQIVAMEVHGKPVNLDWFYDPAMQEGRTLVDL